MLIKDIKKELIKRGVTYNGVCYEFIKDNKKTNFFISNHFSMNKFIMTRECYEAICFIVCSYKIDVWNGARSGAVSFEIFQKIR